MKKKSFILLFAIFYFVNGYGQVKFIPGLSGGITYASLSNKIENKPGIGFEGKLNLVAQLGDKLDLITEYSFKQKSITLTGYEYDAYSSRYIDTPIDYTNKLNNFSFSMIANYYLIAPNLSLQLGPDFSYNMLKAINLPPEMYLKSINDEYIAINDIAYGINGLDFSLVAGISGGTEAFRVNLRYYMGQLNYMKNSSYDTSIKGNMLEFSITYYFLNVRMIK